MTVCGQTDYFDFNFNCYHKVRFLFKAQYHKGCQKVQEGKNKI